MIDMGVLPTLEAGYKPVTEPGLDTRGILEAAAAGELDALFIFGADPIADFPDQALATKALASNTFTVVAELFPTETVSHADVVLPSAAYAEREGTFTNLERRLQKLEPVMTPKGTAREAWRICAGIASALGTEWKWATFGDVWSDLKKEVPTHKDVDVDKLAQDIPTSTLQYESQFETNAQAGDAAVAGPGGQYPKGFRQGAPFQTGQNWPLSWELRGFEARQRPGVIPGVAPAADGGDLPGTHTEHAESASASDESGADQVLETASLQQIPPSSPASSVGEGFKLLAGRFIYDEGAMVAKSVALRNLQRKPFVEINDEDAKELDIADGDQVVVSVNGTEATVKAVVADIVRGAVFVPYDQVGLRANSLMDGSGRVEVRPA
jgi:predicted molibdopterin-dependent oxidoreductase YjgC